LDNKTSFLGFSIQLRDLNNGSIISKAPINLDGTFKMDYMGGDFEFGIYDGAESVEMDDKSVSMIMNNEIYIPHLNKFFKLSNDDVDLNKLMKSLDYIKDNMELNDRLFIERLVELAQIDGKSNVLLKIYDGHVNELALTQKNHFKFSKLLENVENKLKFLNESIELDDIILSKDYGRLKAIHEQLIEEYVKENRNEVIRDCFYNLKYEGIYSSNQAIELIEKGQVELDNSNYDNVICIITELYELDERVF